MKTQSKVFTKEASIFTKAFVVAGISFMLICLIGFATWAITDIGGALKGLGTKKYDWSHVYNVRAMTMLTKVSITSIGLIFVSGIMRIIWWFKFNTASKMFIYSNFIIYIIAQGLGFGILFTTWRAQEILTVFGIAGLAFATMAWAGYIAKDLSKMMPFLIMGSLFIMIMMIPLMIMSFMYNIDNLWFAWTIGVGILTLMYTMYDVWSLKKTSEFMLANNGADEITEFRIISWFGFRLLTDIVQLVWVMARLYMRMKD